MDSGLESEGNRVIFFGWIGKIFLKITIELKFGWWEELVVWRFGLRIFCVEGIVNVKFLGRFLSLGFV